MGSESIAHEADEGKRNNNYIVEANKADGGVEFYPSISQDLLNKALNFASAYDKYHERRTKHHHTYHTQS